MMSGDESGDESHGTIGDLSSDGTGTVRRAQVCGTGMAHSMVLLSS
jgi:hypothetical protein